MTPLETASEIIGRDIAWVKRDDRPDGTRYFLISFDGIGYRSYHPRELRNLDTFRQLFNVPDATPQQKRTFLESLHRHCDTLETPNAVPVE